MAASKQVAVAHKLTHAMVYEQCGTMRDHYVHDYEKYYPRMLEAVELDERKALGLPTDQDIETMIGGTSLVITDDTIGPLCPHCNGHHKDSAKDHIAPDKLCDTYPEIHKVIFEYNE